jgi:RHS repeat-associated protein
VPQAGTVSYGVANADNGLTTMTASSGSATMSYDGNLNLTYDGYNTLSYDVENRMVQAENLAWGTSTYLYDPLGQRKQKVVGGNTAMPVATDFVLAGGEEIADYYESSATWRLTVRGAGGLPLVTVVPAAGGGSEEIVYVHHDMKGSTVALTVPGGTGPSDTYTYSDYGAPQSGTWLAYQYAGYRYDSETGLYHVRARYYSPALGRFLQSDPSGFSGGLNLYAYAGNDPVNLEDPTGESPDGGGYTIALSESIPTFFMGVDGVPSLTVAATANTRTTCTGSAIFSGVGGNQAKYTGHSGALYSKYPAKAGGSIAGGAFGTVAVQDGFLGLSTSQLRALGTQILITPSNQGLISQYGGPKGPLSVSDYGDANIQGRSGVAFDLYRFPTKKAGRQFGLRTMSTTISFPKSCGASCPAGFSVTQ